jgi:hypothetical protein
MKKLVLLSLLLIGIGISCEKDEIPLKANAEIIRFNSELCMCCWGWTIKMGNDTIKSDSNIIGEVVGYESENPISVFIELGEKDNKCTTPNYPRDYYEIKRIVKIEK